MTKLFYSIFFREIGDSFTHVHGDLVPWIILDLSGSISVAASLISGEVWVGFLGAGRSPDIDS